MRGCRQGGCSESMAAMLGRQREARGEEGWRRQTWVGSGRWGERRGGGEAGGFQQEALHALELEAAVLVQQVPQRVLQVSRGICQQAAGDPGVGRPQDLIAGIRRQCNPLSTAPFPSQFLPFRSLLALPVP